MGIRTSFSPMGTFGKKLPPGYIELEYLESTGTQYIDTGIVPDTSTRWEVRLVCTGKGTSGDFDTYGTRCNVPISHRFNIQITGRLDLYRSAYGYGENSYWDVQTDAVHTYCIDAENLRYRTDEGQWNPISGNISGIVVPIMLFAMGNTNTGGNTVVNYTVSRCYYSKIWKNSKLVRNFIPTLDPTGRPCMFDTVTQQPFYNQGTGKFKFGYKLPAGYIELEYLESTGTQYITVPYTFINHSKFAAKLDMQAVSNDFYGLMGFSGAVGQWFRVNSNRFEIGATAYITAVNPFIRGKIIQQIDRAGNTYTQNFQAGQESVSRVLQLTEQPQSYGLFGTAIPYTAQAGYHYGSIRLFSAEIRVDDVLKQRLIPALDPTGRPCMFDTVTQQPYYNQGTGEFLYA